MPFARKNVQYLKIDEGVRSLIVEIRASLPATLQNTSFMIDG